MNRGYILHCAKTDFGAHEVTYPIDKGTISREINRWVLNLTILLRLVLIMLEICLHTTISLNVVVLNLVQGQLYRYGFILRCLLMRLFIILSRVPSDRFTFIMIFPQKFATVF
jgi:hypothetical protein